MRIAGHAEVLPMPPIRAELDGVVAHDVRGIADPLEFVLLLIERAVARVHGQRVAEIKSAGSVQDEVGHAGSVIVVQVETGNARILGRGSAHAVGIDEYAIAEKAEAEV